jgi:cytochrome d ubiquinol oxidase subunit II
MEIPFLNLLWFILLGVLLAGYAILDGFDLGVGIVTWAPGTIASGASS